MKLDENLSTEMDWSQEKIDCPAEPLYSTPLDFFCWFILKMSFTVGHKILMTYRIAKVIKCIPQIRLSKLKRASKMIWFIHFITSFLNTTIGAKLK